MFGWVDHVKLSGGQFFSFGRRIKREFIAALKRERPFDVPADTRRVLTGTGRTGLRGARGKPPDLMERLVELAKYFKVRRR